ncbi:hypothetical protein PG984_002293 [Apiospora sp. TS-2023a]
MSLICRKYAHWQPNSSTSCVKNWQRLSMMEQINVLPSRTQPEWSAGVSHYTHSSTQDPAVMYYPRSVNDTMEPTTMDLDPSEGTATAPHSQAQSAHLGADHRQQQRQTLPPLRAQPVPQFPLSRMTTTATNNQDFDDDEDDTSMYLGGDEEERALFEEGIEPTVSVSIPNAGSHVVLPPLRPSPGPAGPEAAVHHPQQQPQPLQITYFNSGNTASASRRLNDWLDESAENASSIPIYPPPIYPTYPAFFRPVVCYDYHISDRVPKPFIPMDRPTKNSRRLVWGRSPLAQFSEFWYLQAPLLSKGKVNTLGYTAFMAITMLAALTRVTAVAVEEKLDALPKAVGKGIATLEEGLEVAAVDEYLGGAAAGTISFLEGVVGVADIEKALGLA